MNRNRIILMTLIRFYCVSTCVGRRPTFVTMLVYPLISYFRVKLIDVNTLFSLFQSNRNAYDTIPMLCALVLSLIRLLYWMTLIAAPQWETNCLVDFYREQFRCCQLRCKIVICTLPNLTFLYFYFRSLGICVVHQQAFVLYKMNKRLRYD